MKLNDICQRIYDVLHEKKYENEIITSKFICTYLRDYKDENAQRNAARKIIGSMLMRAYIEPILLSEEKHELTPEQKELNKNCSFYYIITKKFNETFKKG